LLFLDALGRVRLCGRAPLLFLDARVGSGPAMRQSALAVPRRLPDDDFAAHDRVEVRIGKQPYARFDRNDYSVPHDHVRRTVVVVATSKTVRVLDGDDVISEHVRSFDRGALVENPEHLAALTAAKRQAREQRGMDRLHHAVPTSAKLLAGAALRGHNIGSAVAALLRLIDTSGSEAVEAAVQEVVAADMLHVAAVRQVLERRRQERGRVVPLPVHLPDDPRVRDAAVRPHDLATYDDIGGQNDDD
jgi:hypothetical protein